MAISYIMERRREVHMLTSDLPVKRGEKEKKEKRGDLRSLIHTPIS